MYIFQNIFKERFVRPGRETRKLKDTDPQSIDRMHKSKNWKYECKRTESNPDIGHK